MNKLVVANTGWADTIPEWLLEEVKTERMVHGLAGIASGTDGVVGDAEVAVYLYTECLTQPPSHEHQAIYEYLAAKLMRKKEGRSLTSLPDFLEEKLKQGLTDWEQTVLGELRSTLYRKRGGEIEHPLLDVMREFKKGR